ncbi:filamin-binding LIM protein 1 [Eucyclogobius newberryi]|uniref:filamin-binding LIM protein 1 n=1 Tax=Eucyclogobius newberryi TaxID=166745 RepID=UPI003B5B4331
MPQCLGVHACQHFIANECVMFFIALCPRLTVHLLRLERRWYCHSARVGGVVDGQERAEEREGHEEKEWLLAESSSPLKSSTSKDCTGGRLQKQSRSEGKVKKQRRQGLAVKDSAMASAASPKRMVSSVFITLASPHRGTVTQQQQPTLQAHSSLVIDNQQTAVRISPTNTAPTATQLMDRNSTNGIRAKSKDETLTSKQLPSKVARSGSIQANPQQTDLLHTPLSPAVLPSSVETTTLEETPHPAQETPVCPLTQGQQPVYSRMVEASTPSSGLNKNLMEEPIHKTNPDEREESKDVCGFCRKSVNLSEPAIEALNRTYHEACFQCRSCHIPLACKQYYNKAGIPLCEDCYQASLELCWACGEVIKYQVMRALERAYHPQCFMCTTCKQQIGEQRFAQGEVGEVYCLPDYYRKYAPKCRACNQLIIPKEDGTDSYTIECLGHSYHEDCYTCEMCFIHLNPEPNEKGCYPLDGKLLCKACHLSLVSAQHGQ